MLPKQRAAWQHKTEFTWKQKVLHCKNKNLMMQTERAHDATQKHRAPCCKRKSTVLHKDKAVQCDAKKEICSAKRKKKECWNPQGPPGQQVDGLFKLNELNKSTSWTAGWGLVKIHDGPRGNKVDGLFRLRRFEQNNESNSWPGPQRNKAKRQQTRQAAKRNKWSEGR